MTYNTFIQHDIEQQTTQDDHFPTYLEQQTIKNFCATYGIAFNPATTQSNTEHFFIHFSPSYIFPEEIDEQDNLKISFLLRKLADYWGYVGYSKVEELLLLKSLTTVSQSPDGNLELTFFKKAIAEYLPARCTAYPMHPLLLNYVNDFPQFNAYLLSLITPPFVERPIEVMEILHFYDLKPFVTAKLFNLNNIEAKATFDLFEFLDVLSKRFFLRFQTESLLADLIVHNMPKTIENFIAIYNSCATILDEPLLNADNIIAIDCRTDSQKQGFYNKLLKFPKADFKIVLYHEDVAYLHCDNKLSTLVNMS